MKTEPSPQYSSLYRRLSVARIAIPTIASTAVILFEIFEHGLPFHLHGWTPVIDILVFGVLGPALAFLALTWLANRVRERDEAEARLAVVTAHERELLAQLERSMRAERFGLAPTLESILSAIGAETSITGAAVYLRRQSDGNLLSPVVSWPSPETAVLLQEAVEEVGAPVADSGLAPESGMDSITYRSGQRVVAVPVTDHGETLGVLMLSGPESGEPPDPGVLGVVAGAIALLIRNNQLYARLQSQAVIDERSELAREVHDGLAQSLGFLNFKAQQVKRLLERGHAGEAIVAVDELCDGSREVYDEVRVLIRNLRSSVGVAGGFLSSIRQYSAMLARRTGLDITVEAGDEPNISPEAQLQLFRVVQEALSNAHRHGMARRILIRLSEETGCIILSVEDDGLGLPPPDPEGAGATAEPEGHFGLRIMRERMQSIGGDLEVESRPDHGTTVRIRVPSGCADASGEETGPES